MMARLGDVCEILDSKRIPITASNRKAGKYPYYGANGMQDYVDDYIFDDELVLLAEDGGHFGSTDKPIAYRVSGKCWVNNHAHVLKPKAVLDVDYLCYSLMFRDVSGIVNGATRQKLTQADMREIEIPLLPLGEQLAIVEKLNKIFALISLRKQQLFKLDELIKSRFIEMFGDCVSNTNSWETYKLNEVCDVRDGTHDSPEYFSVGIPLITSKNITSGYIDFSNVSLISESDAILINKRSKVDYGDILLPMIGTVGGAVIVDSKPNFCIKNVALIKFTKTDINNVFVREYLNSDVVNNVFESVKNGGTQKFVGLGTIRNLTIAVPPISLQNEFADFVKLIDKSKFVIKKSLEKLETLKKSLMQKYFG